MLSRTSNDLNFISQTIFILHYINPIFYGHEFVQTNDTTLFYHSNNLDSLNTKEYFKYLNGLTIIIYKLMKNLIYPYY